jgi:hypothetical protein
VPKWLLPTVSEIVAESDPTWGALAFGMGASQTQGHGLGLTQGQIERQWQGAIAALTALLQQQAPTHPEKKGAEPKAGSELDIPPLKITPEPELGSDEKIGLVISGPLPILGQGGVTAQLATWTFTHHPLDTAFGMPLQLLPAASAQNVSPLEGTPVFPPALAFLPGDPLAAEQFCLVRTRTFSVVMVVSVADQPTFMVSFLPDVVEQVWDVLRPRIALTNSPQLDSLDDAVGQFPAVVPSYQIVMQFSRLLLQSITSQSITSQSMASQPGPGHQVLSQSGSSQSGFSQPGFAQSGFAQSMVSPSGSPPMASPQVGSSSVNASSGPLPHGPSTVEQSSATAGPEMSAPSAPALDVELLQAIAHEIRTPLTTIRTLTRLLLKRQDLHADVIKRLGMIDRECSEQIDRFGLIFRVVELATTSVQTAMASLTRTSLAQVFADSIPRWQQQASQRSLTLEVVLPQRTPMVVSDPSMLDKALTSLIERFTRSLPAGSHIWVEVTPAGNQLKVQLRSQLPKDQADSNKSLQARKLKLRSLGQVLMFQPETGSLSLNMAVTKHLFQALGGKLIVRQRPEQGEVMTVFLPLEKSSSSPFDNANILDA